MNRPLRDSAAGAAGWKSMDGRSGTFKEAVVVFVATFGIVMLASALGCDTRLPAGPSSGQAIPRGPFRLSGRVLDFGSNAGVAGMTVAFAKIGGNPRPEWTTVTDTTGAYTMVLPDIGSYVGSVEGTGGNLMRVPSADDRGDLFVHGGECAARYGIIADARTFRAVAGATVVILERRVLTGPDGWYRVDVRCTWPSNPLLIPVNTTVMSISHPQYGTTSEVVGRGVFGVIRRDVWLERSR